MLVLRNEQRTKKKKKKKKIHEQALREEIIVAPCGIILIFTEKLCDIPFNFHGKTCLNLISPGSV